MRTDSNRMRDPGCGDSRIDSSSQRLAMTDSTIRNSRSGIRDSSLTTRPAPAAVRVFSHILRWMPVGRYRLIHESRRVALAPFVAHLSSDLGGLAFQCDPRDSVARE